jgi:hypothetical protein
MYHAKSVQLVYIFLSIEEIVVGQGVTTLKKKKEKKHKKHFKYHHESVG